MKKITKKKGFTLVETLVAISILLIAIMSPMTIAQSSLSSAGYARNEFVAQYLNQDALEWIKNIKDYSAMVNMGTPGKTTANWLTFNGTLTRCVSGDGSKRCEIDTATSTASSTAVLAAGEPPRPIEYNPNSQLYGYDMGSVGSDTVFGRVISIIPSSDNADEALVIATTTWTGNNMGTSTIRTFMYNFR